MKQLIMILLFSLSVFIVNTAEAKNYKQSELTVVSLHASWCSPCERMQKESWPKKSIKDELKKFKEFKSIDTDTEEGEKFIVSQQINLLPATVFLNSKGEAIKKVYGFMDEKHLLETLKQEIKVGVIETVEILGTTKGS